ncbi:MAG: hypothetical protein WDO73_19835 [Ignavibacteriota bacterium]
MAYASAEPGCVGAGVIVPSHMASKPSEIEDPDSKPISRELRLTAEPHRRRTQVGENIPRSETYNSNCDAIAAAALSTRTITMLRVAKTGIDFLEPWYEFVPDQANAFLRELKCELAPDHPLYNIQLQPLGHSGASDNAIFSGGRRSGFSSTSDVQRPGRENTVASNSSLRKYSRVDSSRDAARERRLSRLGSATPLELLLSLFPLAFDILGMAVSATVESFSFEDQADTVQMWTVDEHCMFANGPEFLVQSFSPPFGRTRRLL